MKRQSGIKGQKSIMPGLSIGPAEFFLAPSEVLCFYEMSSQLGKSWLGGWARKFP